MTDQTNSKPGPQAIDDAVIDDAALDDATLDGVSGGAHIDLYRNIWINGTETPAASREAGGTLK